MDVQYDWFLRDGLSPRHLMLIVDGGPGIWPRALNNRIAAAILFWVLNLNVLFVTSYEPRDSKKNPVERGHAQATSLISKGEAIAGSETDMTGAAEEVTRTLWRRLWQGTFSKQPIDAVAWSEQHSLDYFDPALLKYSALSEAARKAAPDMRPTLLRGHLSILQKAAYDAPQQLPTWVTEVDWHSRRSGALHNVNLAVFWFVL